MNRRNIRGRLDRLERAEPDTTVRPDWDALFRGDIDAWLASLPEQTHVEEIGDPIEELIAQIGRRGTEDAPHT